MVISNASDLAGAIDSFRALRAFGERMRTVTKSRFSRPLRVIQLSDDVFQKRTRFGSVITLQGKLIRYGLTYRPRTFVPMRVVSGRTSLVGNNIDPATGAPINRFETRAVNRLSQFPVQVLPVIQSTDGPYRIAFIYPDEFDGFLLNQDREKQRDTSSADCLAIGSAHQAIPVLLPRHMLERLGESVVRLTGIVAELPDETNRSLLPNLCETRRQFFYGFYRPTQPVLGFCIDCRDPNNSDVLAIEPLTSLRGAFYLEAHFEGLSEDFAKSEILASVPEKPGNGKFAVNFGKLNPAYTILTEDNDISFNFRAPNAFGLYIEANLLDSRDLHLKLERLRSFYQRFRKTASSNIRAKYGKDHKVKLDFLSDFDRQLLFHPEGVLSSGEVDEAVREDTERAAVISWLRGAARIKT